MKAKIDSTAFLCRLVLVASPLGIVCLLLGQYFLDEADYISLLKYSLLTIYICAFLAAFFNKVINTHRNNRG
jgi:cytochrome c biogenesis protein CcdA